MITSSTLSSGVRVVLEEIPYVQSVAIGVWVKAGAVCEESKYAGISHYVEHMMFKGTGSRNAKQIAEDIDKIGGQINAFTGKEATCYYVKALGEDFYKAADVLLDMMSDSLFDRTEMNRERMVICEEIKMSLDSPEDLGHDTVTSLVFKDTPLGNSVIGTPTSLSRISHNVITNYVEKEYTRDSIVISVSGNFNSGKVCEYLDKKLMNLAASKEPVEYDIPEYKPAYRSLTKDIKQAHICLATKGVPLEDERYFPLAVLNNIMGESMSSRFFQNVREEKGLAYSVYSMQGTFSKDGYFSIYAGVNKDKIREAVDALRYELEVLDRDGVTEDEFKSSVAQLKAAYVFGQENVSGRMFKNGKNMLLTGNVHTQDEIVRHFDEVTMEDVDNIKSLICDFSKYSATVVAKDNVDMKKIMRG